MLFTPCNDILLYIGRNFCDFYIKINLLQSSKLFKGLIITKIPSELYYKLTDDILINFPNLTNLTITNNGNITSESIVLLSKLHSVKLIVDDVNLNTTTTLRSWFVGDKNFNIQYFLLRYNVDLALESFDNIEDITLCFFMNNKTYRTFEDMNFILPKCNCWIGPNMYETVEWKVQCICANSLCTCKYYDISHVYS